MPPPDSKAVDWNALVAEGLKTLEALAGQQWTDYNEHDPGVTLLEALAYGLTDLGYRAGMPVPDLMADELGRVDLDGACLFTPPRIFPSAPVTPLDLRKVVLDQLPGLANLWFTPQPDALLAGHVRVWLLPASLLLEDGQTTLVDAARRCLSRYRSLGDVFDTVTCIAPESVHLTLCIRVRQDALPEQVLLEARNAVARALAPPIVFQPYPAPSETSTPPEALFEGPLLSRGSVQDADLWEPRTPEQLHELVAQALLSVEAIEELVALEVLPLPEIQGAEDTPRAFEWDPCAPGNDITVLQGRSSWKPMAPLAPLPAMAPPPGGGPGPDVLGLWADSAARGSFSDVRRYDPVQDTLPPCYRLEPHALPPDAPALRVAQVRQLRAYLFVFEQLLANAFAQLAHAPRLLSCREPVPPYVWQPLYALEGADTVLKGSPVLPPGSPVQAQVDAWASYQEDPANPYASGMRAIAHRWNEAFGQPEGFLDCLLARFAESLPSLDWQNFETLEQKRRYLARYPELSAQRHIAFDLEEARRQLKPLPSNVSVLEHRVNLMLAAGPREPLRQYASLLDAGGAGPGYTPYLGRSYYLMEHPLLLGTLPSEAPSGGSGTTLLDKDFFSLRLTHVLTNWTWFPLRTGFQEYVESFIRESAPAHLDQVFLWLEPSEMDAFTVLVAQWYADGLPLLDATGSDAQSVEVRTSGSAYALAEWLHEALRPKQLAVRP
ncbi:hypothetical protein [Stigmatella aurantiaca]|uniref:Uncharacterized protein n=1 Tax=Stigmatella aurantiaca (strain DW4/3-1) TaxID=378806 RepID=Q09DH1_STIAD|nr:hypothetical protein [Stigmatella aurantiaca]ADO69341.1 uncharacterized protein STAUR_1537 [Stigmatella aurantiaca DW4/3-1]EAU69784.1 conserved hypothetical protein [Stigmatella aurantiaca DW4/3-1]